MRMLVGARGGLRVQADNLLLRAGDALLAAAHLVFVAVTAVRLGACTRQSGKRHSGSAQSTRQVADNSQA